MAEQKSGHIKAKDPESTTTLEAPAVYPSTPAGVLMFTKCSAVVKREQPLDLSFWGGYKL